MDCALRFELDAVDPSGARAGRVITPHGEIPTPVFMPVGTQGSVKSLSQEDLEALGAQIILGNAYHLYLRPGLEILEKAGGLHRFMGWNRSILTDSGGFQLFSLAQFTKVTPEGVQFQSHIDGSRHTFTPESAVDSQLTIGSDIMMCLDECTAYPATYETAAKSMRLSMDWAARCKARWEEREAPNHALFGIVQGSVYEDLRRESAERLLEIDFPGYAIGGVSVGESRQEMISAVEWTVPLLPEHKPRYLMGVGPPEDLLESIERGIDMFDCVMPTRNARNGTLFTSQGKLHMKNAALRDDFGPLDPAGTCPLIAHYTRAYASHLYRSGEILALRLNTLHNLFYMLTLAANARQAILDGRFRDFKRSVLAGYGAT